MVVILKFYRNNNLVRTEICTNEFEADLIAESEKHNYSKIESEYEEKNSDAV